MRDDVTAEPYSMGERTHLLAERDALRWERDRFRMALEEIKNLSGTQYEAIDIARKALASTAQVPIKGERP